MGLNLGVFWQTGRYICPFSFPVESGGFTGVFLRESRRIPFVVSPPFGSAGSRPVAYRGTVIVASGLLHDHGKIEPEIPRQVFVGSDD